MGNIDSGKRSDFKLAVTDSRLRQIIEEAKFRIKISREGIPENAEGLLLYYFRIIAAEAEAATIQGHLIRMKDDKGLSERDLRVRHEGIMSRFTGVRKLGRPVRHNAMEVGWLNETCADPEES